MHATLYFGGMLRHSLLGTLNERFKGVDTITNDEVVSVVKISRSR